MKFLDESKIFIRSGDGGIGCVSFRREKYIEFGGPNGGNGGKGGNIYIQAVNNLNTLIDYRYKQHFKAKRGEGGKGSNMHGKNGEDIILKVPVGTQVLDESGEFVIADLLKENQKIMLLEGGDGGRGNTEFKSSTNRAPRKSEPGWPGQEQWIWLKLKLIADVGIIGLPNAGKSTFLSVTSRAKPKIADYPFTTLIPQLGVINIDETEFVMADIPGLIENSHRGQGLGIKFLKHIERTNILLHLIDVTEKDPCSSYQLIRNELKKYSKVLYEKKEIIALNKTDSTDEDKIKKITTKLKKITKNKIFNISAISKDGVKKVLRNLQKNITLKKEEKLEYEKNAEWKP